MAKLLKVLNILLSFLTYINIMQSLQKSLSFQLEFVGYLQHSALLIVTSAAEIVVTTLICPLTFQRHPVFLRQ